MVWKHCGYKWITFFLNFEYQFGFYTVTTVGDEAFLSLESHVEENKFSF